MWNYLKKKIQTQILKQTLPIRLSVFTSICELKLFKSKHEHITSTILLSTTPKCYPLKASVVKTIKDTLILESAKVFKKT